MPAEDRAPRRAAREPPSRHAHARRASQARGSAACAPSPASTVLDQSARSSCSTSQRLTADYITYACRSPRAARWSRTFGPRRAGERAGRIACSGSFQGSRQGSRSPSRGSRSPSRDAATPSRGSQGGGGGGGGEGMPRLVQRMGARLYPAPTQRLPSAPTQLLPLGAYRCDPRRLRALSVPLPLPSTLPRSCVYICLCLPCRPSCAPPRHILTTAPTSPTNCLCAVARLIAYLIAADVHPRAVPRLRPGHQKLPSIHPGLSQQ